MRSSLSVTGSTQPLLLSVMAIRYSPNNSMNRGLNSRPFTSNLRPKTSGDRQQSAFCLVNQPWHYLNIQFIESADSLAPFPRNERNETFACFTANKQAH